MCYERACELFYRMLQLSEETKVNDVQTKLNEEVRDITLTKKPSKQRRITHNKQLLFVTA